jgi:hypothetical protein
VTPRDGDPSGVDGEHGDGTAGSPDDSGPRRRRLSLERREVIAALDRLADDTFGRCDVCGVQISDRRLRIAPASSRCPDHLAERSTADAEGEVDGDTP